MTRSSALISMVALFVAGVAVGALGMQLYEANFDRGPTSRWHGPPRFLERLADDLQLTPEQREQIATIHAESRQRSEAVRQELRPQLQLQMEQTREKILAVLTPEQREELERMRQEFGHGMDRFFLGDGRPRRGPPGRR